MSSSKNIIKDMSQSMGLYLGKDGTYCHGLFQGYPCLIDTTTVNHQTDFHVMLCAMNMGAPIDYTIFDNVVLPGDAGIYISNFRVNIVIRTRANNQETIETLSQAISMIINILKSYNYTGCDDSGSIYNISLYKIGDSYYFYSIDNAALIEAKMEEAKQAAKGKNGNIPLGILGAILGALGGSLVMFLVARLGYISFYTGLLTGFFIMFLYKKFAGNMSLAGAIISTVIATIFIALTYRLDATLTIKKAYEDAGVTGISFWEYFRDCKAAYEYAEAGSMYTRNMVLTYIFGIGGTALMVFGNLFAERNKYKVKKMG